MNLSKLARLFVIVFVVFWIISAPTAASNTVHKLTEHARSAGYSMIEFTQGVLGGTTPTERRIRGSHLRYD